MIALKLTTVGSSTGVVLPKEVLTRLKVKKGDTLYLVETPDGFQITPYDESFVRQVRAAERVMREHRDVLHELADALRAGVAPDAGRPDRPPDADRRARGHGGPPGPWPSRLCPGPPEEPLRLCRPAAHLAGFQIPKPECPVVRA